MVLVDAYVSMWKNALNFSGRSRRSAYWYAVLANVIVAFVLGFIGGLVSILSFIAYLYEIAVIVPSLALGFRRIHDLGKPAWWLLLVLIPFVGAIILIVFFAMEGQPMDNQYGPNPKMFA